MRTYEERTAELRRRTKAARQARQRRRYLLLCAGAAAGCLALTLLAALGISMLPNGSGNGQPGQYAASLITNPGAGGYIAAGLAGLCLGAALTGFCFYLKRNMENGGRDDDREL